MNPIRGGYREVLNDVWIVICSGSGEAQTWKVRVHVHDDSITVLVRLAGLYIIVWVIESDVHIKDDRTDLHQEVFSRPGIGSMNIRTRGQREIC